MSAPFEFTDPETKNRIALYYEDDRIALNTVEPRGRIDDPDRWSYHEIYLSLDTVDRLIEALAAMRDDIKTRYT